MLYSPPGKMRMQSSTGYQELLEERGGYWEEERKRRKERWWSSRKRRWTTLFIGPESDHWQPLSVTNSLTPWRLVYLTDVTLAFEEANSDLFRLLAQGLVKILKLKFRRHFEAEVWSVFCC